MLCACGCGQEIIPKMDHKYRPVRFIRGHSKPTLGHTFSAEIRKKWSQIKLGDKNPMWKGNDDITMNTLHRWVEKRLQKPELCQICKEKPPYDLANKGIYNRDLKNWYWLCRSCHMKSDGRIKNLKQYQR